MYETYCSRMRDGFNTIQIYIYQPSCSVVVQVDFGVYIFWTFFLGIQKFLGEVLPKVHVVAASSPLPVPDFSSPTHVAATRLQLPQTARYRHLVNHASGGNGVSKRRLSVPCKGGCKFYFCFCDKFNTIF